MSIYLDNASTTKPNPDVLQEMRPYLEYKWYNPSSKSSLSDQIRKDVASARNTVGEFLGTKGKNIFFTSGGSEANCWAIQGFINYSRANGRNPIVITSVIEHKSVLMCLENLMSYTDDLYYIGVDKYGFIDIKQLEERLQYCRKHYPHHDILVSIQFANNEIGTVQGIRRIAELSHANRAIFHTDAVQIFGHTKINVEEFGIDLLSASGHKIGTTKGVGFLYIREGVEIKPLIYGTQMDGMRGGTENVPYIMGMKKAVELCEKNWESAFMTHVELNDYIKKELVNRLNVKWNGSMYSCMPNIINVTFPQNITAESMMYILETSGIYVSAGSACNSRSEEPSYVLKAIGLTDEEAARTIRISLPDDITKEEIDTALDEMEKAIRILTTCASMD